jgi:enoyl-CoA hydratase
MNDDHVLTRREGAVGVMSFNRADKLNALNMPMMLAIEAALSELEADPQVRAIVMTGADDRAFMAGGDIADLATRRPASWYDEFGPTVHRIFRRIETCDKPTLAAVNGWALGGGMELMLCTDLRVMAAEAKIGLPEIKLGLFPGGGGSQRLMRQIPLCQAKKLMFTADSLTAAQALQLGLVNEVVPRAELMAAAMALAARVASMSAQTLKLLKHAMLHGAEMPLESALAYERAMLGIAFDHPDAREGCNAFLQKRPARFAGT